MADITLAECNGRAWLLAGEQYIDDLLANTLAPHVTIEVIQFQSKSAIDAAWTARTEEDPSGMWMIHPGVLNRAKGQSGLLSVQFAAWSAAMDAQAEASLQTAVAMAEKEPGHVVALIRHEAAGGAAMAAEMGGLRCGLIEARLAALGLAPARIVREVAAATEGAEDRVDVVVRPG